MKKKFKKIVVIIPCHNEEKGIAKVIDGFSSERIRQAGYLVDVIVIDNNSSDKTAEVADASGVTVVYESKPGKGNALQQGFRFIPNDADYIVMIDGDNTYDSKEILRMVEPLNSGFCNVVIGSRLAGKILNNSMSLFNRVGNWMFSFLVRNFYKANVTDVLTGYFAWTNEALMRLRPHLISEGFGIEMEMVTKMAILGEDIYCVPITYTVRSGDSNLRPINDGVRILAVFIRNFFWKPELKHNVKLSQPVKRSV